MLVDDENSALDMLSGALKAAGYSLYSASSGEDALRKYQSARPTLILLELFLPDMDGKDLLRRLRSGTSAPILVVSARNDESEIIACLDSGADDYITIPFTMGELLARIRAALRRAFGGTQGAVFTAGELKLDYSRREVFVGHKQVALTATEYHLLNVLVRHAGRVRTHYQLIHEVWGSTQYQDAVHLLRVTVSNLRRKLASDSGHVLPIITEPGVGYRLQSDSAYPSSASFAQAG
jgi:two-component system KDP operon response regulator KdpE